MLIDLGYRNHFDLDLLSCPDLSVLLSYGTIPSKEYLGSKPSRLGKFVAYCNVLWKLYSDLESPRANDVMSLMQTGVNPNLLENIARDMHDPEVKSEILRGLDKNLCNIKGESFYEMFSRTISSLSSLRLKISTQNVSNYWSLTEELILHIVDQGLEGNRVTDIARLVSSPIELSAWLGTESGDFGIDDVKEWIRYGFRAEEAELWCRSQFDAATASKWRNVTESPIAARRRVEAGIRPPR
jgi:hypothetical protein